MSIEIAISPSPSLDFDDTPLPEPLRPWLADLRGPAGRRWTHIVPSSRRRRQMLRNATRDGGPSMLLPRLLTIDGLMTHLAGYSRLQRPLIGNAGRLLRVARAWQETHPKINLTPGRVEQLDGIISDWRECAAVPPAGHPHEAFAHRFERILNEDRCFDRPGLLTALADEIADEKSPAATLLIYQSAGFLFDGFHRFSEVELRLIEAIGRKSRVRIWFVADGREPFAEHVKRVIERLGIANPIDDSRGAPNLLAELGRAIFRDVGETPLLALRAAVAVRAIVAPKAEAEVDRVARLIKQTKRDWSDAGRLSDIAVVVPDDRYVTLVHSALEAAGIACAPSAERFRLETSRPARLLRSALHLIRHGWPEATLFDFLRQPLISRRLTNRHFLEELRKLSRRSQEQRGPEKWQRAWRSAIDRWQSSPADPEREHFDRTERADDLRRLVDSIGDVLNPVRELGAILEKRSGGKPAQLVAACAALLHCVDLAKWLSPAQPGLPDGVPEREWEIDQLAFSNLLDVLKELAALPGKDFPRDNDGSIDIELSLHLALAAEGFQTSADDDAGVQLLRPATIRGSCFRAIFVLGLVEGKFPSETNDADFDDDPTSGPARMKSLQRIEQEVVFAQIFESASEFVVLCRPEREEGVELIESPYLRRITERIGAIPPAEIPSTIVDASEALARAARLPLNARMALPEMLPLSLASFNRWRASRQDDAALRLHNWALPLIERRYAEDRCFSATALETYASCPFRHFVSKMLALEEEEWDDSAARHGTIVHDVLEEFFSELHQGWEDDEPIPTVDREEAEARFWRLFDAAWQSRAHGLDPSLRHDFEHALGGAFVSVALMLQELGFRQVAAEWEIPNVEIGRDSAGRKVLLSGFIDRVDRNENGVEIICDFKTGEVKSGGKLERRLEHGRALQLPLYAHLRERDKGKEINQGIYVRLSRKVKGEPVDASKFLVRVGRDEKRPKGIEFRPRHAKDLALRFAGEIRSGRIALTEFDVDDKDPACGNYCPARHACRQPKGY